jgi:FkbM family methyltransferase
MTWAQMASPSGSRIPADVVRSEVEEYFALGATVRPGDTVLDVGANIGAFSLRVAELCGGDVRLLCFEPSPPTFAALKANFGAHPLLRRTRHKLFSSGLGAPESSGRDLVFYHFRRFPTNSTFDIATKRREFEVFFEDRGRRMKEKLGSLLGGPVEAVVSSLPRGRVGWWAASWVMGLEEMKARIETLDEALARENVARVDLLKLDAEGLEIDILRSLGPASWPKVKQVVLDLDAAGGRGRRVIEMLRENGLTDVREARQTTVDNGLESVIILARRPPGP